MKTYISYFIRISLTFFSFSLFAFSCNKEKEELTPCNKTGKTAVVVVGKAVCGWGAWGNLWLMDRNALLESTADNNKRIWLQPYSIEVGINYVPQEGETIEITYTDAKDDGRYKGVATCMAYSGANRPIHIICIRKQGQ